MTVDVAFVWHMHQPYYRLPHERDFFLPWVRLHAVKAYHDMAWALREHPDVRATVNFSGSLCEQLLDYVEDGRVDLWWRLTQTPAAELTWEQRRFVIEHFFSIHHERLVHPVPRYAELLERRRRSDGDPEAFDEDDLRDLQVLFNLQWCGFALRRESDVVARLLARGRRFTEDDKVALLDVHARTMAKIGPMWRELAERGQVELSATPHFHPILPLIIDSDSAREGLPDHPLPSRFCARADAEEHVRRGLDACERLFGVRPAGMWPAEGSVSPEAADVFASCGVRWIATDEHVLKRSVGVGAGHPASHLDHWQVPTSHGPLPMLFRDHALSDLIGFSYARNDAAAAAHDLVERVKATGRRADCDAPCAVIILDGENPWEAYVDDGGPFLEALYRELERADDVQTVTPSDLVARGTGRRRTLQRLHAGSWIDACFRIWIGVDAKNRAWELLGRAREALAHEARVRGGQDDGVRSAREALLRAEGSDWFWWYGDDFTSANDAQFDELFRAWCSQVYVALELPVPPEFGTPIGQPTTHRTTHPPERFIRPVIDGRLTSFYEWEGAGRVAVDGPAGAMAETRHAIGAVRYGFDAHTLYLRIDPGEALGRDADIAVEIGADAGRVVLVGRRVGEHDLGAMPDARAAFGTVLELAMPLASLHLRPGDELHLRLRVLEDGVETALLPAGGPARLRVMGAKESASDWIV